MTPQLHLVGYKIFNLGDLYLYGILGPSDVGPTSGGYTPFVLHGQAFYPTERLTLEQAVAVAQTRLATIDTIPDETTQQES